MATMGLMNGKLVMITGATSGIGYFTAQELARMGAAVILVGRDLSRCVASVRSIQRETDNQDIAYLQADFSSLRQVRSVAQTFLSQHNCLDVLINNAGTASLRRRESADGYEMTFAVNHLSHFLLTNLLQDSLKASRLARVITVSSGAHYNQLIDFDNLQLDRSYNIWNAYGRSKLANILFAYELARRLDGTGITSNAMTPGMVATQMWRKVGRWVGPLVFNVIKRRAQSPSQGAETIVYLATSPEVEAVTGKYYAYRHPIPSSDTSHDLETARRLWEVSAQLTGLGNGIAN